MPKEKEVGTKWWYIPHGVNRLYQVEIVEVCLQTIKVLTQPHNDIEREHPNPISVTPDALFATKNGAKMAEARRIRQEIQFYKIRAIDANNMIKEHELDLERVMTLKPYRAKKKDLT